MEKHLEKQLIIKQLNQNPHIKSSALGLCIIYVPTLTLPKPEAYSGSPVHYTQRILHIIILILFMGRRG